MTPSAQKKVRGFQGSRTQSSIQSEKNETCRLAEHMTALHNTPHPPALIYLGWKVARGSLGLPVLGYNIPYSCLQTYTAPPENSHWEMLPVLSWL